MKAEKINYKGYSLSVIGNIPTGSCMTNCLEHINALGTSKGTFKMQVIVNGWKGTISTIKFKKI